MKLSPVKTFIYYFLQLTWGIIQNALGLLLWIVLYFVPPVRKTKHFYGALVTRWRFKTSLGLGIFIFLGRDDDRLLVHEYGHTIQSMLLGPLFLPLIGIPSFIHMLIYDSNHSRKNKSYYNFYTEKWANVLGVNITGQNTIER